MVKMSVEYVPIGNIKPYENNAKKHPDDQIEQIAASIKEFGWQQPIVVDKNSVVIIGHGRLLAAVKMGLDSVPVAVADDLTEQQVKALRLADNLTNESEWDSKILESEILSINMDLTRFGFSDDSITELEDDFFNASETNSKPAKEYECPYCGHRWKE